MSAKFVWSKVTRTDKDGEEMLYDSLVPRWISSPGEGAGAGVNEVSNEGADCSASLYMKSTRKNSKRYGSAGRSKFLVRNGKRVIPRDLGTK
jgi:hypothetical protein